MANKLRVFTAFSGYDSQMLGLRRVQERHPDLEVELVGWSEIDPAAIKAHDALFPEYAERNYGDISRIDWSVVPDFDLFTYSSPCQDFSAAGLQRGGTDEERERLLGINETMQLTKEVEALNGALARRVVKWLKMTGEEAAEEENKN